MVEVTGQWQQLAGPWWKEQNNARRDDGRINMAMVEATRQWQKQPNKNRSIRAMVEVTGQW